jgi:Uncharacterized protein conserved in bacteria
LINIGGRIFELVLDHKGGWNPEAFRERYSEVLDRYDYVIGDWGYNQLRLKGFFRDDHPKATKDTAIGHLVDYLHEYCNFGCAYFVLRRVQTDEHARTAGEEEPLVFTSALPATGETAAGLAGKAAALPGSDRLMRWRADQSTGREGRALRIAAERAELEALILQRELREAREQQKRQAQPHKSPGHGQPKPQGQGGGQHGHAQQGHGQHGHGQHGGKRGASGGRRDPRGEQHGQGAPGKGDRPHPSNGRKPEAARGDAHRNRQPNPRAGEGPRGPRHPRGDRQQQPNGEHNRHRRPNAPQTAPAGSGET